MNIAQPVTSEINGVAFSLLLPSETRKLSVKQIYNPQMLDALNNPVKGGVYDTALGPINSRDLCSTCMLDGTKCPGHFGHIELPCPVVNPLLWNDMLSTLRGTCFYCGYMRANRKTVMLATAKLRLLHKGLVKEALDLDIGTVFKKKGSSATRVGSDKDEAVEDNTFEEDTDNQDEVSLTQFSDRLRKYCRKAIKNAADIGDYKQTNVNREVSSVIKWISDECRKSQMCRNCGALNPRIRAVNNTTILKEAHSHTQALKMAMAGHKELDVLGKGAADKLADSEGNVGDDLPLSEDKDRPKDMDVQPELMNLWHKLSKGSDTKNVELHQVSEIVSGNRQTLLSTLHIRNLLRVVFAKEAPLLHEIYGQQGPYASLVRKEDFFASQGKPDKELEGKALRKMLRRARESLVSQEVDIRETIQRESLADIFFIEVLPVSPNRARPPATLNGEIMDHPHNGLLNNVLITCADLRLLNACLEGYSEEELANMLQGSIKDKHLSSMGRPALIKEVVRTWSRLQHDVNALIDSSRVSSRGNLKRPGIRQLLEKKEGLFRMHMMGKRVNYSARSVISPDPNIETNEIGIPPVFATRLTFPEPVTTFNIKELRKAVINGPNSWPGATHVQHEDGSLTVLERLSHESRVALANQLLTMQDPSVTTGGNGVFAPATMGVNKKVYRHIRNGDMLLVNRQPTLHKPSIMAHRAVVLPGEKTIRMHYANCNTYNADFDGDEMNLHYPQNELARAEAALIAITDKQYLVPTSGDPLRGLIQDHVVMGTMMTKQDTFFTRDEYQHLLYSALRPEFDKVGDEEHNIVTVPPTIWRPRPLWTGKQVITSIILNLTYGLTPPNLKSQSKVPGKSWSPHSEEGQVLVVHGELLMGVLDKSQFGASGYGLIHTLYELYGPSYAGQMLSILGRLFTFYSQMRAYTCRMDDLLLTPEGDRQRREVLKISARCGAEAAVDYVGMNDMVRDPMNLSVKERHDFHIRMEEVLRDDLKLRGLDTVSKNKVAGLTSQINNICIPGGLIRPFPANHMQAMTISGAKGSDVNARQISGLLGQQDLEGRRVPVMVSGKTLPSFRPFDSTPRANGFVGDRFLTGIRPQEFYFHCMAGRDGLIDTAVKTANSGYLQRCLIKHMEGIRVEYDHTVRDSDGSLIQFYYGEDALDVTKQKHLYEFGFAASNYAALKEKYQPKLALKALDLDQAHGLAKKAMRKPEKYPPVMSLLSPSRYLGSTSEKFLQKLKEYIGQNPDRLLCEDSHGKKPQTAKGLLGAMVDPECNKRTFHALMELQYMHSLADPGESVGLLAAQGVGEPSTQMTLNTFHLAGFGDKNVTLGIPRLREIVMTASVKPKTPNMTLPLLPGVTPEQVKELCQTATRLSLAEVLDRIDVYESTEKSLIKGLNQRVRKYKLHLQFYPAEEYEHEYGITPSQLESTLVLHFLPQLKTSLNRLRKACSANELSNFFQMGVRKTTSLRADHGNGGDLDEGNDDDDEEAGNDRKASAKSGKRREVMDDVDLGESDDSDADDDGAMDEEDGDRKQVERRMARQRAFANADEEDGQATSSSESEDDEENSVAEAKTDGATETPKPNAIPRAKVKDPRLSSMVITQNQELITSILQSLPWLVKYEFDLEHGRWCKIELEFPTNTPKLLMVDMAENAARKSVVNEIPNIKRCFQLLKEGSQEFSDELATDGVNFSGFWDFADVIDVNRITSNDIYGILTTYGVEAARASIMTEVSEVFERYHITVDPRHISLIADYMTFEGGYKPFNRLGLRSSPMPFAKMSFETTCNFLKSTCLHGDYDQLSNPSSRIVVGKPIQGGTGAFDVLHNLG